MATEEFKLLDSESIKKAYKEIDKHPLQYMSSSGFTPVYLGTDFGKEPDYTGVVKFWAGPFKYKTAGFDHPMLHNHFGVVWSLFTHNVKSLQDLPIKYNFDMAKEFYKNWNDELLNECVRKVKKFIVSLYGECTFDKFVDYILRHTLNPKTNVGLYQLIYDWLFKKKYYIIPRGRMKYYYNY